MNLRASLKWKWCASSGCKTSAPCGAWPWSIPRPHGEKQRNKMEEDQRIVLQCFYS